MNCKLSSNGLFLALVSMAITSQASASNTAYRYTDLGTLGGSESSANAINNAGMVAGWARTASGEIHATVWNATGITDLGTLGGTYSIANDINDLGQVVGAASTMGSKTYATLWNGTQATQLGTSTNVAESAANAINNSGQAVGWTQRWARTNCSVSSIQLCSDNMVKFQQRYVKSHKSLRNQLIRGRKPGFMNSQNSPIK